MTLLIDFRSTNEAANTTILSELRQLTDEVQQTLFFVRSRSIEVRSEELETPSQQYVQSMRNLEVCLGRAGRWVSAANSIISSRSAGNSQASELGEDSSLQLERRTRLERWIAAPDIPEEETASSSEFPPELDHTSNSGPFTDLRADQPPQSPLTVPSLSEHGTGVIYALDVDDVVPEGDEAADEIEDIVALLVDDPLPEIEANLIQHLEEQASAYSNAGEDSKAEELLEKLLMISKARYGDEYEGKDKATKMLAMAYCRLGKLRQAEEMIQEQFEGRDQVMAALARSYCRGGMWESARNILGMEFMGRDKTLESLALEYCQEKKWEEAEMLLDIGFQGSDHVLETLGDAYCREGSWEKAENITRSEFEGRSNILQQLASGYCQMGRCDEAGKIVRGLLRKGKTTELLDTTHALAVQYKEKGKFRHAELYCLLAISGRKAILGDFHVSYYQSRYLLAQIYEAQNQGVKASGLKNLLPQGEPL
jgi:hypothetical protein